MDVLDVSLFEHILFCTMYLVRIKMVDNWCGCAGFVYGK